MAMRTKHPAAMQPPASAPPAASEPAFWPSDPIKPISPPIMQAMTITQIHIFVLMLSLTLFVVRSLNTRLRIFCLTLKYLSISSSYSYIPMESKK